jgi:hypothetical protein
MKKSISTFVFVTLFFTVSVAQMPTVDSLIKTYFVSLKNNDKLLYKTIFPDNKTIKEILSKSTSLKDDPLMDSILSTDAVIITDEDYYSNFESDKKKIKKVIPDLKTIIVQSIKIEKDDDVDEEVRHLDAYKALVKVTPNGKSFEFNLTEILAFNKFYYGVTTKKITPKTISTTTKTKPTTKVKPKKSKS